MRKTLLTLIITLLLSGCYQVDIQQGNVIDQDAVAKLHLGQSKNDVTSILGAPILNNIFSANIWTYAYTNQVNGGKIEKKTLQLKFQNNKLIKIN